MHVTAACDVRHKPECEPNHNGVCLKAQPSRACGRTLTQTEPAQLAGVFRFATGG